jgi:hypothetical protein
MASPKCSVCGRFMRRLKFIERLCILASEETVLGKGSGRTHICKHEEFTKDTAVWEHIK